MRVEMAITTAQIVCEFALLVGRLSMRTSSSDGALRQRRSARSELLLSRLELLFGHLKSGVRSNLRALLPNLSYAALAADDIRTWKTRFTRTGTTPVGSALAWFGKTCLLRADGCCAY
jgi:hypothetical protein